MVENYDPNHQRT